MSSRRRRPSVLSFTVGLSLALIALVVFTGAASAIGNPKLPGDGRNFDARNALPESPNLASPAQLAAVDRLRAEIPSLTVRFDSRTGALRTLSNQVGYLTTPRQGVSALDVGLDFVAGHLDLMGLTPQDLDGYEITDTVPSRLSGANHVYLRQQHAGIPVYNGQLQFNVARDGRLLSINNAFQPNLAGSVNALEPAISSAAAVRSAADHLGIPNGAEISLEPITPHLMWLPVGSGEARLVWNFQIFTTDDDHAFDMNVDAVSGKVWTRFDWVADAQYKVLAQPIESPIHTAPPPPADARTTEVDPHDVTASPFGWHDTNGAAGAEFTNHRGNNVHAWEDSDGNNTEPNPATEPDCGAALDCTFPLDLSMQPSTYRPAAVTELFYWNNVIHDIQYQYGFDEESGNFQQNNYGNGGTENDSVRALAQSGAGTCNANFLTQPDGTRPRMRMYICNNTNPSRDGDFDHMVIVHEYGHGISNRLVGGPANTSCLNNTQQPGEGWSDWLGLVYTAEAGDAGPDVRGTGTYLFGQAPDGPGIRPQPYSTNPAINTWTYQSIAGMSVPHGVGAVWAQGAWEAYWALVDEHGFEPDLYDPLGGGGNQRMMLYVTEGMKNTACSPTFLDVRDGIIQAAEDNYGGEDVCLLWEAFAAYGWGTDATTVGPNSQTATNGFQIPIECQCVIPVEASALSATPNGDNRIDLSWTASPTANVTYNVYRSFGGCPQSAPELIASGLSSPSYSDLTVSGGTTYSYAITTVDETGNCESAATACSSATATGLCIRPPTFGGIDEVVNSEQSSCQLNVNWSAATGHCGTPTVVYNVYRSTTPEFTPGPANLLASCLTGSTYADNTVISGTEYFYVVRAEDDSGNGGGPCDGGNEEANVAEASGIPTGPIQIDLDDDIESGTANWTLSTGGADTGTAPWSVVTSASHSPTQSWFVSDQAQVKDQRLETVNDIVSPGTLSFWHSFNTEATFDGGVLEYSTDGGTTWFDILAGNGGSVPANPGRFVQGAYNATLSTGFSNPLPGRRAWSGNSSGFVEVIVDMADFVGESVSLRWRFGCDSSVSGTGWWVDDVLVSAATPCNSGTSIYEDGFETGDLSRWSVTFME